MLKRQNLTLATASFASASSRRAEDDFAGELPERMSASAWRAIELRPVGDWRVFRGDAESCRRLGRARRETAAHAPRHWKSKSPGPTHGPKVAMGKLRRRSRDVLVVFGRGPLYTLCARGGDNRRGDGLCLVCGILVACNTTRAIPCLAVVAFPAAFLSAAALLQGGWAWLAGTFSPKRAWASATALLSLFLAAFGHRHGAPDASRARGAEYVVEYSDLQRRR